MAGRRGNHEGSIYQRTSDQRWMGAALIGYNALGKPVRKYASAKTRTEVVQKLKKMRRQIDDGLQVTDTGLKVAQLFERWHDDILRHQVGLAASSNYKSVADHHIVPLLGNKKVVDLRVTDIDRLTHRCKIIETKGESYRLQDATRRSRTRKS